MNKFISPCILLFLIACNSKTNHSPTSVFTVNMDTTVKPVNDFFDYANGGWIKTHPIPADESSWGIGYLVNDENNQRLRDINKEAASYKGSDDMARQKIGDFWKAASDTEQIESEGLKYLQPYLDSINNINDYPSFIKMVAELHKIGVNVLLNTQVTQDDKISNQYAFRMDQGGLGLPDKDYYFNSDSATVNVRIAYAGHLTRLLSLMGQDITSATRNARFIFTFETRLAMSSRELADLRDPYANYHKMPLVQLDTFNKNIQWINFLYELGIHSIDSVVVGQPEFLKSLDQALAATQIEVLKSYLIYHLVNHYSEALPRKFGNELFQYKKWLTGAKKKRPDWKRIISNEQVAMGELLGQLYVKKYFDSTSKKRYEVMASEIKDAYAARINNLEWMTDNTKLKALHKLDAIKHKIGYPDKWKDFSAMQISDKSYVLNMINAARWWYGYDLNKLGKPVDRDEWFMFPQTYNAYYDPSNNEIVFPAAAFIVPGYADNELDDAVMYGYAGASYIGHEITHGFDDQGRLYDATGNLHNWWTSKDSAEFAKRAALIIKQFDDYKPLPGYHINGRATQGENIADLGGVEIGIDAFKKSNAYKENKTINGFTPMQRFFMGYALSWLYEIRPEQLRQQLMTDVHSPAKYRVNGPMSNVMDFYKVYQVKSGDKMFRPDSLRVKIW